MFKLVLVSVLIAIVAAKPKPSGLYGAPLAQEIAVDDGFNAEVINTAVEPAAAVVSTGYVHEPVVASAGHVVHGVPTSVSHHSTTTVQSKANYLGSVATPGVHTYSAPLVKTYSAPVVASAAYTTAPIAATRFAAAVPYTTGAVVKSYAAGPVFNSYATPYSYGAAYPYATAAYRTYAAPAYYSTGPVVKSYVSSPVAYNQIYAK